MPELDDTRLATPTAKQIFLLSNPEISCEVGKKKGEADCGERPIDGS